MFRTRKLDAPLLGVCACASDASDDVTIRISRVPRITVGKLSSVDICATFWTFFNICDGIWTDRATFLFGNYCNISVTQNRRTFPGQILAGDISIPAGTLVALGVGRAVRRGWMESFSVFH